MTHTFPGKGVYRTTKFRIERDIFVALCGASLFLAYLWNTKHPQISQLSLLNFLGLYLFYRWLHISHLNFINNKQKYFSEFVLPLFFSLFLFLSLRPLPLQFYLNLLFTAIIAALYNLKIRKFRLRTIPYLKSILISFLWVLILVYLPESLSNKNAFGLIISLVENFLFILALTVMYDIYDIYEDEEFGIKTLVNFKFNGYAEGIVIGLLLFSLFPSVLAYYESKIYFLQFVIQLIVSIIGIIMVSIFKRRKTIWLLLLWDGLILAKALLIILTS